MGLSNRANWRMRMSVNEYRRSIYQMHQLAMDWLENNDFGGTPRDDVKYAQELARTLYEEIERLPVHKEEHRLWLLEGEEAMLKDAMYVNMVQDAMGVGPSDAEKRRLWELRAEMARIHDSGFHWGRCCPDTEG